jgi:hypothetical protein
MSSWREGLQSCGRCLVYYVQRPRDATGVSIFVCLPSCFFADRAAAAPHPHDSLSYQRCVKQLNLRSQIKSHFSSSPRAPGKQPLLKDMPHMAVQSAAASGEADDDGKETDISLEHVSLKLRFENATYRSGVTVGEDCPTIDTWINRHGQEAFNSSQVRFALWVAPSGVPKLRTFVRIGRAFASQCDS